MGKIFVRRGKPKNEEDAATDGAENGTEQSAVHNAARGEGERTPDAELPFGDRDPSPETLADEPELGDFQTGSQEFSSELPESSASVEPDPSAIEKLELEVKEYLDKYLRAVAEHENFKRRAAKERSDLIKYAGEYVLRDLLDVVDNLERAVAQEVPAGAESLHQGVKMVLGSFISILERHGIRAASGKGKGFNPVEQEALATVPTPGVVPGTVIDEFRKAYHYKDKVLRTGQVVVASEAPQAAPNGGGGDEQS